MNNHSVYFYEDDTFLIDKVAQFAKTGLEQQETVIIVATDEHRNELRKELVSQNLIGLTSPNHGKYVTLDAAATLQLFLVDNMPNDHLFIRSIGLIIRDAAQGQPIRIYGEMVAVLWARGQHRAAIRLEELWNKLAAQCDFSLLCGYPMTAFDGIDNATFQEVCACHAHSERQSIAEHG